MSRQGQPQVPGQPAKRDQRISSLQRGRHGYEFSAQSLTDASAETVTREYRGNVRLTPAWSGLIAAQLHGGRVIR